MLKTYYVPNAQRIWPGYTVIIQLAESVEDAAAKINDRFVRSRIMTWMRIEPSQVREVTDSVLVNSVMDEDGTRHYNKA